MYFTTKEVADMIGTSKQNLAHYIKSGVIRPQKVAIDLIPIEQVLFFEVYLEQKGKMQMVETLRTKLKEKMIGGSKVSL